MTEQPENEMPKLSENERAEIMAQEWHQQEATIKGELANGIREKLRLEYEAEKAQLRGNHLALTWLDQKFREKGLWSSFDDDPRLQAEAQKRMKEIRPFIVEKTLNSFEVAREEKRQEQLRAEHSQAMKKIRAARPEERSMLYVQVEQDFRNKGLKL